MAVHVIRWLTLVVLVSLTCFGQEITTEQVPPDPSVAAVENPQPEPTPAIELEIPAAEIPDRSRELNTLLREVAVGLGPDAMVVETRDQFAELTERVQSLGEQTEMLIGHEGGLSALEDTERQWLRVGGRLDE